MNLDAELYLNLIRGGAASLAQSRQEINDLNVFPIPDGDTGDNMYMTISFGADLAYKETSGDLGKVAHAAADGMLRGARGNSGVILSRIFAGIVIVAQHKVKCCIKTLAYFKTRNFKRVI